MLAYNALFAAQEVLRSVEEDYIFSAMRSVLFFGVPQAWALARDRLSVPTTLEPCGSEYSKTAESVDSTCTQTPKAEAPFHKGEHDIVLRLSSALYRIGHEPHRR